MQKEFLFAGFGGQGVMFAGQLLAYAALDEGFEVTWIPSYGPEMRGGTAHCFVVISDKVIGSPVVRHPTIGVVFNKPSFTKYESTIATGGILAVNSSLTEAKSERHDITCLAVPASQIADSIGNPRLTNVVMLGAVLGSLPLIPKEAICRTLEKHLPERHRNLLEANFVALEKGILISQQTAAN